MLKIIQVGTLIWGWGTHLKEEHERHPLIVAMIAFLLSIFIAYTGCNHICTDLSMLLTRYRESVRYPAECVDHVHRYRAIVDAANGITLKRRKTGNIIYLKVKPV